jgi:RHS repeat-associated protein
VGVGAKLYRFNGIEHSEELGLDLAVFRSYDPAIGRWLQIDPMAEAMPSMTPYRFGFNNPVLWSDPLGLFETRKEAKKHREANGLEGRVRKQEDGRFGIVNKSDHSITINDGELGIVTAGYVQASGIDKYTNGTNDLGGPVLTMQSFMFVERRDSYENQQRRDPANGSLTYIGKPQTGSLLELIGPSGGAKAAQAVSRVPIGQLWAKISKLGIKGYKPQGPGTYTTGKALDYLKFVDEAGAIGARNASRTKFEITVKQPQKGEVIWEALGQAFSPGGLNPTGI